MAWVKEARSEDIINADHIVRLHEDGDRIVAILISGQRVELDPDIKGRDKEARMDKIATDLFGKTKFKFNRDND